MHFPEAYFFDVASWRSYTNAPGQHIEHLVTFSWFNHTSHSPSTFSVWCSEKVHKFSFHTSSIIIILPYIADFYSSRRVSVERNPCRAEIMPAIFPDTSRIILKTFYIPVRRKSINKAATPQWLPGGGRLRCHHILCDKSPKTFLFKVHHIFE